MSGAQLRLAMARSSAMALEIYEYRDPGQVIADVLDRRRVRAGDVLVALTRKPSTEQKVIKAVRLSKRQWRDLDQYVRRHPAWMDRLHVRLGWLHTGNRRRLTDQPP
jgi:hypothetical protein